MFGRFENNVLVEVANFTNLEEVPEGYEAVPENVTPGDFFKEEGIIKRFPLSLVCTTSGML